MSCHVHSLHFRPRTAVRNKGSRGRDRRSAPRVRGFLVTVILGAASTCGVAGVADAINGIRAQGCPGSPGVASPLAEQPGLEEAARRLAAGDELSAALAGSGYRATTSTSIHIRTTKDDVAGVLVERFCDTAADPELTDIGAFQQGDETWVVLAAPFVLPSPVAADDFGQRVIELINETRREPRRCGRERFPAAGPLTASAALQRAASAHARDMASGSFLDHRGSDGSSPAERVSRSGYAWKAVAENVAAGAPTAEDVVNGWLASPGHCTNLMSARYSESGVAVAIDPASEKGTYWVQVFAAPK